MVKAGIFLAVITTFASAPFALANDTDNAAAQLKPIAFQSDLAWRQFPLPTVSLSKTTKINHFAWQEVDNKVIEQISYNVARLLYKDMRKAPKLPTLHIVFEDLKGVAYKEGDFNGATIHISANYMENFSKSHSETESVDELIGILYHEIAHAYQLDDHNYKEIGPIIEGIADVVRLKAGYIPDDTQKPGGNYKDGYKNTAFFIDWLSKQSNRDLLQEINAQLDPHDDIKWDWQYFEQSAGVKLDTAWQHYQASLL
ncbi:basic secretory protein-like protein [Pseudoalteromonas piscicida]|uniref:basic secretory protein-like protein n=1 Tax=Pseudoalteromonas piscicida TaxID=43662 RepID=UPI000E35B83B|nr:basic secretory protein-like protein [Pseudoalteromonas piscicida]AXQ99912.1 secretion protein [Pseudoalteromonas piscicida]